MEKEVTTAKQLRAILKDCIHNEFEKLPELLMKLKPKERLELLVKLLPYALPKSNKVTASYGESTSWDFD